MALHAAVFRKAALRHAHFYRQQLRIAYHQYHNQAQGAGLALFDENWSQVNAAFRWLAQHPHEPDVFDLTSDFVRFGIDFLGIRRPVSDQIAWLSTGVEAARINHDTQSQLDYLNRLGQAYLISKSLDLSRHHYSQALDLARSSRNAKREADALVGLGRISSLLPKQVASAREHLQAARDIYQQLNDQRGLGWCLLNLGGVEDRYGDLALAEAYLQEALAIYNQLGDQRSLAAAHRRLGSISGRLGDMQAELEHVQVALDLGRAIDDIEIIPASLMTLGLLRDSQGDHAAAREMFEDALAYSYKSGNKFNIGLAFLNLGWTATYMDDLHGALVYHRQALEMYRSLNHVIRTVASLTNVGFVEIPLGMIDDAERNLLEALCGLRDIGDLHDWLDVLVLLAWIDLKRGDAEGCARTVGMVLAHPPKAMYPEREAYQNAVLKELQSALAADELNRLLEEGQSLMPETALEAALSRCM